MKLKKLFALALAVCMVLSAAPVSMAGILSNGSSNGSATGGILSNSNSNGSTGGILSSSTPAQQPDAPSSGNRGILSSNSGDSNDVGAPASTVTTTRAPGASSSQTYNAAPVDEGEDEGTPAQRVENAGVETRKDLKKDASGNPVKDANGNYTIRLEAWVTGTTTTTTTTTTTPMDIVLVLDQSGSMAYDFSGNSGASYANSRQKAMQEAVNNFIDKVAEQYDATSADHRMALVTFSSSATTLQGWTFVNSTGQSELKSKIGGENTGLKGNPSGGTQTDDGMAQAQSLLTGSGYSYTGANTTRQKVVILFTDGVPGQNGFDTSVATSTIATSKALKDAAVQVYSIGIFNGVDATQLYGEKWDFQYATDIPCTGEVDSYWGGSFVAQISGSNDFDFIDIAAGNRFLNYVSSNFSSATEIGVQKGTFDPSGYWVTSGTGYKITKNFNRSSSNYYFTANNASSLNNIFTTISETIQSGSSSVQLDSTTTVTDVVSDYFKLPEGVDANNGINVYTAAYKSDGTWGADEPSSLKPTVSGDTVTVTGFDFSANYCDKSNGRQDAANPDKPGSFYGRKLIIEIPIVASDDFLGGEDIPTNTTGSQIKNGDTVFEEFESPTINIPVDPSKVDLDWSNDVTVSNQTIYLTNAADLRAMVSIPDTSLIDGINNKFVTVSFVIGDATYTIAPGKTTGSWTGTYSVNPRECTNYTVTCYIDGQEVTNNGASNKTTATVHVLKPSAEFLDTTIYLSDTPDYNDNKATATTAVVAWTDTTASEAVKGTVANVVGGEPGMEFVCTPDGNFTDCTPVDVDIKIAGNVEFEGSFKVHVLKPTVAVKDSTIYLGETPDYDSENLTGSITWNDENDDASGTVIGDKPSVELEYTVAPGKFTECKDVRVENVKLNGKGNYVNFTTVKNGTKNYFTVHVVEPVAAFQDSTIYLGYTPNQNDFESYNIIPESIGWKHTKEDGTAQPGANKPAVKYSFAPTSDYTDCTTVKATVSSGGVENSQAEREFTVHVIQPTITFADQDIYLSDTPVYAEPDFEWNQVCADECEGTIPAAINKTDTQTSFAYVYSVEPAPFTRCTDVNVSVEIGTTDYTQYVTLKNGDTIRNVEGKEHEFTVHVYLPQIVLKSQNLWADYDCDVTLTDGMKDATISEWSNQCNSNEKKEHSTSAPQCSDPVYKFTLNGAEITSYNAKVEEILDQSTIDVALVTIKVGGNVYEFKNVAPVEYTVTVNKFDLTINKEWEEGKDIYKQDAIFDLYHLVTVEENGKQVEKRIPVSQVVLPTGQNSVTVTGLLCGQDYTVTEADTWTWRWNSTKTKDFESHSHAEVTTEAHEAHSTDVTFKNTLIEKIGELWLSFCTYVENIFTAATTTKGGN